MEKITNSRIEELEKKIDKQEGEIKELKRSNTKMAKIKTKDLSNLKRRIDVCRNQVGKCREILGNLGTHIPKNGPYV